MDDPHLRTIAVELKIAIVNVDYRFVKPQYPVAIIVLIACYYFHVD